MGTVHEKQEGTFEQDTEDSDFSFFGHPTDQGVFTVFRTIDHLGLLVVQVLNLVFVALLQHITLKTVL
jgi:hypothetical protein